MPNKVDLGDLFYTLLSLVNVQQGGVIRPQTDFQNWINEYQLELFWKYVEEYQKSQTISDKISPFVKFANVMVTPISGANYDLVVIPNDYVSLAMIEVLRQIDDGKCCCREVTNDQNEIVSTLYNGTQWLHPSDPQYAQMAVNFRGSNLQESLVEVVDTQDWTACLEHDIKKPTFRNPKATQYSGGFRIAPKGISMVVLTYFSLPTPAVFNYSISNDIPIYSASGSTQLQWNASMKEEILQGLKLRYDRYVGATDSFQMDMKK